MRIDGSPESIIDWPPSPPTDSFQTEPLDPQVPLSWVPPMMSLVGSAGLTDRLWNWIVASPLSSVSIAVGPFFSSSWHVSSGSGSSGGDRPAQREELSLVYGPLTRTRPPSEPTNATALAPPEPNAIACWSGCMPVGG